MFLVESVNAWSAAWAGWMANATVGTFWLFLVVGGVWLVGRRWMSAHAGYWLFMLILLKGVVPFELSVPAEWDWMPTAMQSGLWHTSTARLESLGAQGRERRAAAQTTRRLGQGSAQMATDRLADTRVAAEQAALGRTFLADAGGRSAVVAVSWTSWTMLVWSTAVSALLVALVINHVRMMNRLKSLASSSASVADVERLAKRIGLRRAVRVVTCRDIATPAVAGLFRPTLFLPHDLAERLSARQFDWVVLHELAHIRRGDLWAVTIERIIHILYFFNPVVWLASWMVDQLCECACDEAALAAADCDRRECGAALLLILKNASVWPLHLPPALGMSMSFVFVKWRLRRLLDSRRTLEARLSWTALAALCLSAAVVLPNVRASHGDDSSNQPRTAQNQQEGAKSAAGRDGAKPQRPVKAQFSGAVRTKGGKPLDGARVCVESASPQDGRRRELSACDRDVGKTATTDAHGRFTISNLEADLLYTLLIVAEGHRPKLLDKRAPRVLDLSLDDLPPVTDSRQILRGRVWAPEGKPAAGAIVKARGCQTVVDKANQTHRYYLVDGIDVGALTNDAGEFLLTSKEPLSFLDLEVTARGAMQQRFEEMACGEHQNELPLMEGATLTGRVVHEGNPVAGVGVGITGVDPQISTGYHDALTDAEGRFVIGRVYPNVRLYVFTEMDTLAGQNLAAPRRVVTSCPDRETIDVGDLQLQMAYRLEGQLVLSDGRPVPPNTAVTFHRHWIGDWQSTLVDQDGKFSFAGVPAELIELRTSLDGYRLSTQNYSLDPFMKRSLVGRIDGDTEVLILLEPGRHPNVRTSLGHDAEIGRKLRLENEALQGASDDSLKVPPQ